MSGDSKLYFPSGWRLVVNLPFHSLSHVRPPFILERCEKEKDLSPAAAVVTGAEELLDTVLTT